MNSACLWQHWIHYLNIHSVVWSQMRLRFNEWVVKVPCPMKKGTWKSGYWQTLFFSVHVNHNLIKTNFRGGSISKDLCQYTVRPTVHKWGGDLALLLLTQGADVTAMTTPRAQCATMEELTRCNGSEEIFCLCLVYSFQKNLQKNLHRF